MSLIASSSSNDFSDPLFLLQSGILSESTSSVSNVSQLMSLQGPTHASGYFQTYQRDYLQQTRVLQLLFEVTYHYYLENYDLAFEKFKEVCREKIVDPLVYYRIHNHPISNAFPGFERDRNVHFEDYISNTNPKKIMVDFFPMGKDLFHNTLIYFHRCVFACEVLLSSREVIASWAECFQQNFENLEKFTSRIVGPKISKWISTLEEKLIQLKPAYKPRSKKDVSSTARLLTSSQSSIPHASQFINRSLPSTSTEDSFAAVLRRTGSSSTWNPPLLPSTHLESRNLRLNTSLNNKEPSCLNDERQHVFRPTIEPANALLKQINERHTATAPEFRAVISMLDETPPSLRNSQSNQFLELGGSSHPIDLSSPEPDLQKSSNASLANNASQSNSPLEEVGSRIPINMLLSTQQEDLTASTADFNPSGSLEKGDSRIPINMLLSTQQEDSTASTADFNRSGSLEKGDSRSPINKLLSTQQEDLTASTANLSPSSSSEEEDSIMPINMFPLTRGASSSSLISLNPQQKSRKRSNAPSQKASKKKRLEYHWRQFLQCNLPNQEIPGLDMLRRGNELFFEKDQHPEIFYEKVIQSEAGFEIKLKAYNNLLILASMQKDIQKVKDVRKRVVEFIKPKDIDKSEDIDQSLDIEYSEYLFYLFNSITVYFSNQLIKKTIDYQGVAKHFDNLNLVKEMLCSLENASHDLKSLINNNLVAWQIFFKRISLLNSKFFVDLRDTIWNKTLSGIIHNNIGVVAKLLCIDSIGSFEIAKEYLGEEWVEGLIQTNRDSKSREITIDKHIFMLEGMYSYIYFLRFKKD